MYAGADELKVQNAILICPIKCILLYSRITITTIIAATFMQYMHHSQAYFECDFYSHFSSL